MRSNSKQKNEALEAIRSNIAEHGHHVYVVSPCPLPRFAYTIGVSESIGAEIIFAGGSFYDLEDLLAIVNHIATRLRSGAETRDSTFELPCYGSFILREVDQTWARPLMLGGLEFYDVDQLPAIQIVPDKAHWTVDIPNLSEPWSALHAPVWQWLRLPWPYSIHDSSTGVTNLAALRGGLVTEVMRWEDDQWELFSGSGPDVPPDEMRVVPIGTLLGVDPSLLDVLELPIEGGCWRDETMSWQPWGKRAASSE